MSRVHAEQSAPTLFQEGWWLDIASGGRIERVEVRWDGVAVGALAYLPATRYGLRQLTMPAYTRTLGPVFSLPPSGAFKRGQNIRRVTEALVGQLPRHDYFHQTLDPADESPLAFSLLGLKIVQCFTFVVPACRGAEAAWAQCDQKTRNMIRSAANRYEVVETTDFDRFVALSRAEHPGAGNIHDFELTARLFEACARRDQGRLLLAVADNGAVAAAVALIHGRDTVYFWLSARCRASASGGANALLLWKGIEYAQSRSLNFDCDGYSSVAAAKFLASFGEPPTARTEVIASNWRREGAEYMRNTLARMRAAWAGRRTSPPGDESGRDPHGTR